MSEAKRVKKDVDEKIKYESKSEKYESKSGTASGLTNCISLMRCSTAINDFNFIKERAMLVAGSKYDNIECKGVLYYMHRDQRLQDNWAAIYAQKLALYHKVPLHIVAGISVCKDKEAGGTARHVSFSLIGLMEVYSECQKLNITFQLLEQYGDPMSARILQYIQFNDIQCIITDFSPLNQHRITIAALAEYVESEKDKSLYQVDAHNIVPLWVASDHQEYAARTFRPKIMSNLTKYLTEFPSIMVHPYTSNMKSSFIDINTYIKTLDIDRSVKSVSWAQPGSLNGLINLESFVKKRLKRYEADRNNPCLDACSNLSPWLHFGQLGSQRMILFVKKYGAVFVKSVAAFIEEAVVRSELSDNFCYYQKDYNSLMGAPNWAQNTLEIHKNDKREYIYTKKDLDNGKTHDSLWNACEYQLRTEGKLHGYLRMYWAKKILEWTDTPEDALNIALYLNDKYSLDGSDSNGYTGCLWSIAGVHDQGWAERPVFGKIRYMNYNGCKRKFDVNSFIAKYSENKSLNSFLKMEPDT